MEKPFGIIYKITNTVNNKIYIGQTIHSLKKRFQAHLAQSEKRGDKMVVCRAISKYGKDNFTIEKIDEAYSQKELNDLEIFYISKFNSLANDEKGYNIASGGVCGDLRKGLSNKDYSEWRNKLSEAHIDRIIINNKEIYKVVKKSELSDYEEQGFEIGKTPITLEIAKKSKENNGEKHKNMVRINNNIESKLIYKDRLDSYLTNGWIRGRLKNRVWMNNNTKEAQILKSEIEKYKSLGYQLGRFSSASKGKLYIHKEDYIKCVKKSDLAFCQKHGWVLGTGLKKVSIYKENVQKYISLSKLQDFLSEGWKKGRKK